MPEIVKILVVEDDESAFESYQDSADEVSEEFANITIQLINKQNPADALASISNDEFDGAIIDLNLDESSKAVEAEGNEVINSIYKKNRFPIKVISGNLGNLSPDIEDKKSPFLCFHTRDVENNQVFRDFVELYQTGITKILGRRGKLENMMSDVFWKHLANDMDGWSKEGTDEETLLRYTLNHLNEYLDRSARTYNNKEFYIKPPIQKHIASGDIVQNGEQRFIVVSPACDIAPRDGDGEIPKINANKIILCPLISVDRKDWLKRGVINEKQNKKEVKNALDKIVKNQDPKFHFLPEHGELQASISDFQNIDTCTMEQYVTYDRLATVSTSFMKEVHARFVAYIGRQGQPDLNKRSLVERHAHTLVPPAN
ncbi:hypothetical protein KW479_21460 [Vibrio fluvialis]|nr:hypothetical protein [Vibrio fluvialis]